MRRALCLALLLAAAPARALDGRCVLEVDGRSYLDARCPIDLQPDGSFSIGAGDRSRSKYFASVQIEGGTAQGFWNGVDAESHAHDPLGPLERRGACWVNARARVCAFR